MFFSLPKNIAFMMMAIVLSNLGISLQYSLFMNMPIPMGNMFNVSFHKHYGSYLSPFGMTAILSIGSFSQKAGELTAILLVTPLLDKFGRRFVAIRMRFCLIIVSTSLTLLATILPSFECFMISQFFTAIIFEIKLFATTLFIIECTPDNIRGLVTIVQSLADVASGVVGQTLARPSIIGTEENWWIMGTIALVLNLIAAGYLVWIPETPKRLMDIGKWKEARNALIYYQGKDVDTESILSSYEKEARINSIVPKMTWKQVWNDPTIKKGFQLILVFYMAINLSPYITDMAFSTIIQLAMGLDQETVMTLGSITRVLAVPLSFPVSYAIERYGRRPIVFTTFGIFFLKSIIMSIGLTVVFYSGPSTFTIAIAVFNDFLTSCISAMGVLVMASLFVCELTPLNARVSVSQLVNLIPSVSMTPITALLPLTLTTFPPILYIYPLFCMPPLVLYIYRNLPETKGRKVCDIIEDFDQCVRSRAPTRMSLISVDEKTPLIGLKRQSLLQ